MSRMFLSIGLVMAALAPALADSKDSLPQDVTTTTASGYAIRGNSRVLVDMPLSAFTPAEPKISPHLYLNRCTGGCTVHGGQVNDARLDTSTIPSDGDHTIGEYMNASGQVGAMADAEWAQVVQCMKEVYSPYAIDVSDVKPNGVSYTEALIAGVPTDIGLGNDILGIAPLAGDCSAQDNVISFSFANHHGNNERVNNICWTAAQETAHAFGLDHEYQFSDGTSACNDPMTYRFDCGGEKFFRNKAAQCGEDAVRTCRCGGSQNSHIKIKSVFGDGTSLIPPPTSVIQSPLSGAIGSGSVVAAQASSKRGVAKVQLWLNGFNWMEKPGAAFGLAGQPLNSPYSFILPANVPDGTIDIVVKAFDDLGLEGDSSMVTVTKGSCTDATSCKCLKGQTFTNMRCAWPAATGALGDDCDYSQFCTSGICTQTDQGSYCSQDCIVGAGDACPSGFDCAATSAASGQCLPHNTGGCCSVGPEGNAVWLHIGLGGIVLGLVVRRRRRRNVKR